MTGELIKAKEIPVPHEVIVHPRSGGVFRAEILKNNLNLQQSGYQMNALGRDPYTGKRVSLAPATEVELARPIV